jgi:cholesterol transport system auxiliary component
VSRSTPAAAAAALALAAVALSGCISLFPKGDPAQLYRFGAGDSAQAPVAGGPRAYEVIQGSIEFNRAAAGDRILTVNGSEMAYIAAARWVAPAPSLFEEAFHRAFMNSAKAPRLTGMGRASQAVATLRLDVDAFETRYDQGMESAPTVVVRIRGAMTATKDRSLLDERTFESRKPASDNRVSAIVLAYDAATMDALAQLADWSGDTAAKAAR